MPRLQGFTPQLELLQLKFLGSNKSKGSGPASLGPCFIDCAERTPKTAAILTGTATGWATPTTCSQQAFDLADPRVDVLIWVEAIAPDGVEHGGSRRKSGIGCCVCRSSGCDTCFDLEPRIIHLTSRVRDVGSCCLQRDNHRPCLNC